MVMKTIKFFTCILVVIAMSGCVTVVEPVKYKKTGPPPWAPAHGYHKHHQKQHTTVIIHR